MKCPCCHSPRDRVLDSRPTSLGDAVRRRRFCMRCKHRWTTYEQPEGKGPLSPAAVLAAVRELEAHFKRLIGDFSEYLREHK